jgi:D-sedoheptulose 7-phosphate isomerase
MMTDYFLNYKEQLNKALESVDQKQLNSILDALVIQSLAMNTVWVCGNGGSAAISEHLVCDHLKGVTCDTNLAPKICSLTSETPLVTAIANDIGYDYIFSKQIEWKARTNDILIAISSSGNSPNILNAVDKAKEKGMVTIGFVGFDGGQLLKKVNLFLHVKSNNYGIVEDCHQILIHMLAQTMRIKFSNSPKSLKL